MGQSPPSPPAMTKQNLNLHLSAIQIVLLSKHLPLILHELLNCADQKPVKGFTLRPTIEKREEEKIP